MSKKKQYVILSPDGFTIHPTETYTSKKQIKRAFDAWKEQYKRQGYYSANTGIINLNELTEHCTIKEVNVKSKINFNGNDKQKRNETKNCF